MTRSSLLLATLALASENAKLLPLSDLEKSGDWALLESVSDEFNGTSPDLTKWHNLGLNGNYHSEWKGRAPSQFDPVTVTVKPNFTRKSLEFTTGPEATKATIWLTNFPKSHPVIADHFELLESSPPYNPPPK